jgi:hypothetical protein
MKHKSAITGLLALLTSALPAFSQNDAVYSVNIIGMQKVDAVPAGSGGLSLISMPFDLDNPILDRVVGTNGVAAATSVNADNLLIFNPITQTYTTYWLFFSTNPSFNRKWRSATGFATNVFLQPGAGVWYRSRATSNQVLTLVGDVVNKGASTNMIRPGLQVVSYPFSTSIIMADLKLTNGVAAATSVNADNIQLYNPETQQYTTYWLFSSANPSFNRRWRSATGFATNVVIQPGSAFWYRSRGAETITWVESIPYDL